MSRPERMRDDAGGTVRSIERCIDILDLLATDGGSLSLSDVSRGVGVPKSTALAILRTLVARGLVALDEERKLYRLGLGVARWAGRVSARVDLATIARPHLRRLARETQETATLALTDGRSVYYLERNVGDQPLQYVVPVGLPRPMHGTAGGKIFLAYMTDAQRRTYVQQVGLKRYTDRTVTNAATLERQLKVAKRAGHAVTRAETSAELFGIAAPIFDRAGELIAAVNLGGPLFRLRSRQRDYVAAVTAAATAVSSEIARVGSVAVPDTVRAAREMRDAAE